jgi:hypothetical protein
MVANILSTLSVLATLATAWAAYYIYQKNRKDTRREAAAVLLSEIRSVVRALPAIKVDFQRNNNLVERRYLLENSSWEKYRYVMLSQLGFEQWDALKGFFEAVALYDNAVAINDGYFDANTQQIWINLHKYYLKVLERAGGVITDSTSQELVAFTDTYVTNMYKHVGYEPHKPVSMADSALDAIDENMLVSTVGEKLIQLAK